MSRITTDVVEKTLRSLGIKYDRDLEHDAYVASYTLSDDLDGVVQTILRVNDHLVFTTNHPAQIGTKHYEDVCRDVRSLNLRALMGSLIIDDGDRSTVFRSTVSLGGWWQPPRAVIQENIELGLYSISLYHNEIWLKYHNRDQTDPMFR